MHAPVYVERILRRAIPEMRTLLLLAILLGFGLVSWWGWQVFQENSSELPETAEYLFDFSLPNLDDQPRSIMEWSGKSLVINFWATWCPPCRREMPLLQALQDQRSDGSLQVVGVAIDNLNDVRRFIAQTGITYPNLYGEFEASVVAESFAADFIALPFTVFVLPDGEILTFWPGELSADELRLIVAEMDAVASGSRRADQARDHISAMADSLQHSY